MPKHLAHAPLRPPLPFWSRLDVRRSLTERDAGRLFGLLRQHTGASQQVIGSAVDMAQPHVSAIMSGRRSVTALNTWLRVADGLEMPTQARRALGLADGPEKHDHVDPGTELSLQHGEFSPSTTTAGDIAEITLRDLMKRRDAFAVGGGLIAGAALTELVEHWLAPRAGGLVNGRNSIGELELERIEAATVCLRHWSERWRMGTRRKAVIGQLSEVSELVENPQGAQVQSRLFAVMAELAKIVASMSFDSGDHATAQRYYGISLRALQQAGPEHRAYGIGVLADMARQMLDLHRPEDALDIIRLALDKSDSLGLPPVARSLLRTREAWSYAHMGRAEAFRRSVHQAEDLFEQGGDDLPLWARSFDHAELSGVVGARYRDLGRRQREPAERRRYAELSAEYILRALETRPEGQEKGRAFDRVGLGRTYLVLGDPTASAASVRSVLRSRSAIGSGRVRRRLEDWHTEAAAMHRDPDVAQLREELSFTLLPLPRT
ncbi:hypothetical protein BDW27_101151 [Nocardiopsis sp. L17-MgMaSL7]|nr:hypothetical protein BDW27_101151 [Nocardiopsis sp. L17-MgMaSL7]